MEAYNLNNQYDFGKKGAKMEAPDKDNGDKAPTRQKEWKTEQSTITALLETQIEK